MIHLNRWQLNPVPRGATYRSWDSFCIGSRILYAHQLLYVFSGSGEGCINGESFPLEPGLLVVYGPGCRHEFRGVEGQIFEMGMICFSWHEVDERKRILGNRFVTALDDEYWRWADEPVKVEGLPEIPFRIQLPMLPWRKDFEEQFKELGSMWRLHYNDSLIYRAKALLSGLTYRIEQELLLRGSTPEPAALIRALNFINTRYASDLLRGDVAAEAGISESYLTSLLLKHREMNFSEYLNNARLHAALELLQYSNLSIKEISDTVGFSSHSYFIARFRKKYGISPGRTRHSMQEEHNLLSQSSPLDHRHKIQPQK